MNATNMALLALPLVLGAVGSSAAAQSAPVPLRLHPDNRHYLQFRGKPTVLLTSGEHYGAVLNPDFNYVAYLDELKRSGLNLTRTFSGTYLEHHQSFSITDNTLAPAKLLAPWARGAGDKFDLARFDAAYFARLKGFLRQASDRGIVVEYVLFCTFYDDGLWNINPMNAANNLNGIGNCPRGEVLTMAHKDLLKVQEDFVRKVVGELRDFDNVYYEICNEPYWGHVEPQWQAHIASIIADAEKGFAHRHLVAQNIQNGSAKVEKPDPNVSILNFHYATPPDAVRENYAHNLVIGDDETGFRGSEDVTYRGEGWDFVMAGGAIYSSLDYSFTVKHPAGDFRDYKSPGGGSKELRDQLGILKRFIESFDFVRMSPMNQIVKGGSVTAPLSGSPAGANVSVRVLGESGKAYALYIRGGQSVQLNLDLPSGKYEAAWLNTLTGKTSNSETFDHNGGGREIQSPAYSQDIALSIRRR